MIFTLQFDELYGLVRSLKGRRHLTALTNRDHRIVSSVDQKDRSIGSRRQPNRRNVAKVGTAL
jgi:hypothetical protein